MLRAFLALLTILLAALAYVFGHPWLYVAAVAPLVGALGLTVWRAWTRYQRHQQPSTRRSPGPASENDDLEELGIMDVRPKKADTDEADTATDTPDTAPDAPDATSSPSASAPEDLASTTQSDATGPAAALPSSQPADSLPDPVIAARNKPATDSSSPDGTDSDVVVDGTGTSPPMEERTALSPLLESARVALGAHTVCLLVQEEGALKYRILACESTHASVRREGTFETQRPLLTDSMSRQSVAVRPLDDALRADLGYYESAPPALSQIALALVRQPSSADAVFLLVDAAEATDLDRPRAQELIDRYVDTVDLLLDEGKRPQAAPPTDSMALSEEKAASQASSKGGASSGVSPRPRHELIAEELAKDRKGDFALALVHLNRAESIARQGEEAVAAAERRFRIRLEQVAEGQRVEPFGELTYGIFVRKEIDDIESWAADLQRTMARETGVLEGGVSVGVVARQADGADPKRLRHDATEALREAYETGTCTVVA